MVILPSAELFFMSTIYDQAKDTVSNARPDFHGIREERNANALMPEGLEVYTAQSQQQEMTTVYIMVVLFSC